MLFRANNMNLNIWKTWTNVADIRKNSMVIFFLIAELLLDIKLRNWAVKVSLGFYCFYSHDTESRHGKYHSKKERKTQVIIISVVVLKVHCRAEMGSQKARMMHPGELEKVPEKDRASWM